MISGCVLPAVIWFPAAVIELYLTGSPRSEYLNLLPALYLLFVICLVWSGLACSVLHVVDRRLQGPPRPDGPGPPFIDQGIRFLSNDPEGIRFLPDDARPGSVPLRGPD